MSADSVGLSVSVGYNGLTADNGTTSTSYDGANLGIELSMVKKFSGSIESFDIYIPLNVAGYEDMYLASAGIGARYNVFDGIWLGATAEATSLSLSGDNSSSTSFIGGVYGGHVRYAFNPNHSLIAEYKTGSLTESESGLIDVDVSTMGLSYAYTF
ncbi:hypothetical protein KKC15_06590 [bacterium]|nr:hypothetical protein [bacterium]